MKNQSPGGSNPDIRTPEHTQPSLLGLWWGYILNLIGVPMSLISRIKQAVDAKGAALVAENQSLKDALAAKDAEILALKDALAKAQSDDEADDAAIAEAQERYAKQAQDQAELEAFAAAYGLSIEEAVEVPAEPVAPVE